MKRDASYEIVPAETGIVSRAVYSASYMVSYGAVFPAMLVARAMPQNNALAQGFADGARAARERVTQWRDGAWESDASESTDSGETENDIGESGERNGRRRRASHRRTRGARGRSSTKSS